jgi:hypothetical protein
MPRSSPIEWFLLSKSASETQTCYGSVRLSTVSFWGLWFATMVASTTPNGTRTLGNAAKTRATNIVSPFEWTQSKSEDKDTAALRTLTNPWQVPHSNLESHPGSPCLIVAEKGVTPYSYLEIVIDPGKGFETKARGGSSDIMRVYLWSSLLGLLWCPAVWWRMRGYMQERQFLGRSRGRVNGREYGIWGVVCYFPACGP